MRARPFWTLWAGIVVSLTGSQLADFGLGVSLFQSTRSSTVFALVLLASALPRVLFAPFGGVLLDRVDRRLVLLGGQLGGGACAVALVALHHAGALTPGRAIAIVFAASSFVTPLLPALSAVTTSLVDRSELGRANGVVQFGFALAQIAAPVVAGFLLPTIHLGGLLLVDVASFAFAAAALLTFRLPSRARDREHGRSARSVWAEMAFARAYIAARPSLRGLLFLVAHVNYNFGLLGVLVTPLVLSFGDTRDLGAVLSCGGVGMLLGSVLLAAWGGPARKIRGAFGFALLQGALLFLGAARPSTPVVAAAAFGIMFTVPLVAGCTATIWQREVPIELQGRVFALRFALTQATVAIGYVTAGPLADEIASSRLFVVLGALTTLHVVAAFARPTLRRIDEAPD